MKRSVELRPDSTVAGAASSIRRPRLVTWAPRWCQQRHDGILAISTGLGQSASVALRGERRRRTPSAEAEGIRYSAISGGAHRAAGYPGRPPRRRVARHSRAAGSAEASCFRYLKSARGRSQEPHVHRNAVPARLPIHCKLSSRSARLAGSRGGAAANQSCGKSTGTGGSAALSSESVGRTAADRNGSTITS